jgi:hypothetical protein
MGAATLHQVARAIANRSIHGGQPRAGQRKGGKVPRLIEVTENIFYINIV